VAVQLGGDLATRHLPRTVCTGTTEGLLDCLAEPCALSLAFIFMTILNKRFASDSLLWYCCCSQFIPESLCMVSLYIDPMSALPVTEPWTYEEIPQGL